MTKKVEVVKLPPGIERPELRFQEYANDPRLGLNPLTNRQLFVVSHKWEELTKADKKSVKSHLEKKLKGRKKTNAG